MRTQTDTKSVKLLALIGKITLGCFIQCSVAFGQQGMIGPSEVQASRDVAAVAPNSEVFKYNARAIHEKDLKPEAQNGKFIDSVDSHVFAVEKELNEMIFEKSIADEMKQRYNAYNDKYQYRQQWGLNSQHDQIEYQNRNKDLVDWTIKRLIQYHIDNTLIKSIETSFKEQAKAKNASSGTQAAAKAVTTVSALRKALQNTSFKLSESTESRFKYDLPSGQFMWGLTSPLLNADLNYQAWSYRAALGERNNSSERLSLGVNKQLKPLSAGIGARYGFLNSTLNYGVSKKVVGPINAGVEQVQHLSDHSKDETTFRLNLGASF